MTTRVSFNLTISRCQLTGTFVWCLLAISIANMLTPALATAGIVLPRGPVQQAKVDGGDMELGNQETLDAVDQRGLDSESEKILRNRVVAAAIFGGVVLALLGIVFGYLRLDHATRGFYSGRLQSIAAASAIVVLLTGYLVWVQLIH